MMRRIPEANFVPPLKGYSGQGAFRFWCQTVLPTVYDDSLSYYELLCKVVSFLNTVISDMEIAEENIQSLYDSFVALQEFVNTYIDETAYQQVSRKLDEMVESGEMDELIAPFVAAGLPGVVADQIDDVVDGKLEPMIAEATDEWMRDHPEIITTVQDGSLTEVKFADSLKAKTIKEYVTPEMYGAVGDGVENDTQAVKDAVASGKQVVVFNHHYINDSITITSNCKILFLDGAYLDYDGTGNAVHVTGNNVVIQNCNLRSHGSTVTNKRGIGVALDGCENAVIENPNIRGFSEGIKVNNGAKSNIIYNPYIWYFDVGIHLINASDCRVIGGYIDGKTATASGNVCGVKNEGNSSFFNSFMGVSITSCIYGFYNATTSNTTPIIMIGCYAEVCHTAYLKCDSGSVGVVSFGCNFDDFPNNKQGVVGNQIADFNLQNIGGRVFGSDGILIKSSTPNSTKTFQITVNDAGQMTITDTQNI